MAFAIDMNGPPGRELERSDFPGGLTGFLSWRRFSEQLTQSGELRTGERISFIKADGDGITFVIERKP